MYSRIFCFFFKKEDLFDSFGVKKTIQRTKPWENDSLFAHEKFLIKEIEVIELEKSLYEKGKKSKLSAYFAFLCSETLIATNIFLDLCVERHSQNLAEEL